MHACPLAQTVFAQGDAGDRFFVIADGERDGRTRRRRAKRRSRRATSSARSPSFATSRERRPSRPSSPSRLYALERDDFIAAVTGHAPSREAAESIVSVRLPAGATL